MSATEAPPPAAASSGGGGGGGLRRRAAAGRSPGGVMAGSPSSPGGGGEMAGSASSPDLASLLLLSPGSLRERLKTRARAAVLGDATRSLRASLHAELRKPRRVQLVDKLSFTLGVLNMCATEAVILRAPQWFGGWYTAWAVPLLVWRYFSYTSKRWGYFLIDFCYFVNALALAHLWLAPGSPALFELAFATANGPLAWAIIAWRNSLVFHDTEKITSLFIHAMPPLLLYCRRWHFTPQPDGSPPPYLRCVDAGSADFGSPACTDRRSSLWHTLGLPVAFYVAWQGAYFLKTEVWDAPRLRQDPSIQTSLRWLARSSKGVMHDLTHAVMTRLGLMAPAERFDSETTKTKLAFMALQLLYTVVTLLPTAAMRDHHAVHVAFLGLWGGAAVWHGATYYIDVFSRKYIREIEAALLDGTPPPAAAAAATAVTSTGAAGSGDARVPASALGGSAPAAIESAPPGSTAAALEGACASAADDSVLPPAQQQRQQQAATVQAAAAALLAEALASPVTTTTPAPAVAAAADQPPPATASGGGGGTGGPPLRALTVGTLTDGVALTPHHGKA